MKKLLAIIGVFLLIVLIGCGASYNGEYGDGRNSITVRNESLLVMGRINGVWEANSANITSKTETDEIVILKGETDYSGGSGSAFGVTIKPGQERHWTRPYVATINKTENTIHFDGVLIVSSQDMYKRNVNLQKEK